MKVWATVMDTGTSYEVMEATDEELEALFAMGDQASHFCATQAEIVKTIDMRTVRPTHDD